MGAVFMVWPCGTVSVRGPVDGVAMLGATWPGGRPIGVGCGGGQDVVGDRLPPVVGDKPPTVVGDPGWVTKLFAVVLAPGITELAGTPLLVVGALVGTENWPGVVPLAAEGHCGAGRPVLPCVSGADVGV